MRGRPDVEIFRPPPEQEVANAATDEVGDIVVLMKPVQNSEGVWVDLGSRDGVLGARHDDRLGHGPNSIRARRGRRASYE